MIFVLQLLGITFLFFYGLYWLTCSEFMQRRAQLMEQQKKLQQQQHDFIAELVRASEAKQ